MKPMFPVAFATLLALSASAGADPQQDAERDGGPVAVAGLVAHAGAARPLEERGRVLLRRGAAAIGGDGPRSLAGSSARNSFAAMRAFRSLVTSGASAAA